MTAEGECIALEKRIKCGGQRCKETGNKKEGLKREKDKDRREESRRDGE